jgi:hypothetical protein
MALTTTERKRVEDAVETLSRYNKSPFISNFLKDQPKPKIPVAKYDKDELCDIIKQVLLGEYRGKKKYSLKLEDLIAYLDRLQETGRQHLYLLSLPEEERESLLIRLRTETEVKTLLNCPEGLYGNGQLVWETSDGPQLAQVRYDPPGDTQPRSLVLKWVETRVFWAPQKAKGSQDDENQDEVMEDIDTTEPEADENQRIQVRIKREERAVTFFVIDLENGDCELRIQAIHGRARLARQNQVNTYRTLIKALFGFELVGPAVLAPAVRRALTTREVPIVSCSAILPDGGRFIGGRGELPPVDVRKLQAGVTIRFEWSQRGAGVSRIELDGRLDEVLILRPLLPDQQGLVVEQVRRWRREGLVVVTLAKVQEATQPGAILEESVEEDLTAETETAPVTRDDWISIIKTALRDRAGDESTPSPVEPGIDRAIREYIRTHPIEETATTTILEGEIAESDSQSPSAVSVGDSRPLEQFLSYIKEVAKSERLSYQREIKLIRSEELWYFRLFIVAAVLALSIVATGAFSIIFIPEKLTIGTITGLLGALTGRGTVLIRSYAKSLRTRRELIQDQQRDSQQTLLAIQTALSISDSAERSAAMTSAASVLLGRVAGPALQSTLPRADSAKEK